MHDKLTVLVVDDSRTVRASIRNHLKEEFEVIEAEDGEAGWTALSQNPAIKLVISDIQMPKLDGYGFICRVRATREESIRNKPIIVITGAEDDDSRKRAYACGANDFILKPLEFGDLSSRLTSQIDAGLNGLTHVSSGMKQYESAIEAAVLERPHVNKALEIIKGKDTGAIDPYVIDLCLEVLPLLEYANKAALLDIENELSAIRARLKLQQW
jgi:response regulator RpfG family c-di-GMP phosphodiesterase